MEEVPFSGLRKLNMEKTFKCGLRSLQTPWPKEEFSKAFPSFSTAEQDYLFRLFVEVTTFLHKSIEDEFEFLSLDTQIGTILDRVEGFVEEQSMDPLFSNKTNVGEVGVDLLLEKKNEIQYLTDMLEKAEEQKLQIRAHIERLKKERK